MFVLFIGTLAQIGASIVGITSLLILWEWYTPFTRGLVSGFGVGVQLFFSSLILMAQQILSDPRFVRATDVTPDEQIRSNIQLMFYMLIGLQAFGVIIALLNFRRNSIQIERE
jgi:hypothetical protein